MSNDLIEQAHKLYLSGATMSDVARAFGWRSGTTVLYHFKRHGLSTRPRGGNQKASQSGDQNGNWRGGRVVGKNRHVRLWMPDHANADSLGYVFEHVLIASRSLNRPLASGEVVHHANAIKDDNRTQNLVVCNQDFHAWLHKTGRILK